MSEFNSIEKRHADTQELNRPIAQECARCRSSEAGYAYLMALFLIVAVIIGSQIVLQNLVTQGRRQREDDTIWRGNQWARAIRLYYHKTGHYPQSIDDLESGVPDVHFLRASAIKDPMDTGDGSWRLIYVNSTGQIIGSVRYATLQQMALMDLNNGQLPAVLPNGLPGGVPAASLSSTFSNNSGNAANPGSAGSSQSEAGGTGPGGGSSSVGGTSGQSPQGNSPSGDTSSPPPSGTPDNSGGPGASQNSNSGQTSAFGQGQSPSTFGSPGSSALGQNANPLTQLQPTGPVDGPVVGAFLTGVGVPTAVDQESIKFYHGAKKYKDWEFIWNPLEDQARALQQGLGGPGQIAQPGQTTGANGFGTNPFGNSMGTGSMGSTSPQSPAPQPNQQSSP